MTQMHLCPNCHGQKTVSKPPYIAGDQETWTAGDSKLYPCPTCNGMGYIVTAPTTPAQGGVDEHIQTSIKDDQPR